MSFGNPEKITLESGRVFGCHHYYIIMNFIKTMFFCDVILVNTIKILVVCTVLQIPVLKTGGGS